MNNIDYENALIAGKEGSIHDWTLKFLEGEGNNHSLAKTLRQRGQFHLGPVDYPLKELTPILGPDITFKYYEDQQALDKRVEAMQKSFEKGWRPAPLIASDLWEDYFEIADGAHRYELFKKLGVEAYPTIFFFRDQQSLERFIHTQKASR